ncbi:MAG: hypothetical protein ABI867_17115 [Kofleriaceae bacterium]
MIHRTGVFVVATLVVSGLAVAGGTWSDKTSYRRTNGTSLKVTEPDGFKVTVTMPDGVDKTGTIPDLFALPDADAYVKVAISPPDGSAPWSKKIEVRSGQQAELVVTFKGDSPKGEPAKTGRNYVGRMANKAGGCGTAWKRQIKVEFLANPAGTVVKSVEIPHMKNVDVEVPGGNYDVRVYVWNDKEYKFVLTSTNEVKKDGWNLGFGCPVGKSTPAVIVE